MGTQCRDVKGEHQVKKSEMQSTDARIEDGSTCSRVDASVMEAERRGRIASADSQANFSGRRSP